jgi:ATP-GRASP peptide maturase of grasp-with-spasm system
MILIISNELDRSTDNVINWVNYFGYKFIRLNSNDTIINIEIEINNKISFKLETQNQTIKSEDIKAVWYRKNGLIFDFNFYTGKFKKENRLKLNQFTKRELRIINEFIRKTFKEKPILGKSITSGNMNKLNVLVCANEVGLKIPETRVLSKKSSIPLLRQIIKPIGEVEFFTFGKRKLIPYTVSLTENAKKRIPDLFFPTLFQQEIEKKYEVRVFHLNGINYSMAIFSQKNKKTQSDFRKYDFQNPNRTVPYILPDEIDKMINTLMNKIDLDTGSIDLIVDTNDNYFFLEVNPVGQFGMVSLPCNYYLEKKIAETLITMVN